MYQPELYQNFFQYLHYTSSYNHNSHIFQCYGIQLGQVKYLNNVVEQELGFIMERCVLYWNSSHVKLLSLY